MGGLKKKTTEHSSFPSIVSKNIETASRKNVLLQRSGLVSWVLFLRKSGMQKNPEKMITNPLLF